tara:strand:- start:4490 stop:6925 length:2436 start_codon:yes stop_codon:yes gene_type:complete
MKKIFSIFIIIMISVFNLNAQSISEIYHRAKIYYDQPSDVEFLESQGISLDHGFHKKNNSFESDFSEKEIEKAQSMGYTVEIVIEDVKSYYVARNKSDYNNFVTLDRTKNSSCNTTSADYVTPSNYDIKDPNDFGGFYTYSEMLQELDDMKTQYPNLITTRADIKDPLDTSLPHKHQTQEGRYLQWVKISDNPETSEEESQILYTAIHHAREPASLQQLIFYMWYLLENYDTDTDVKAIIDNTELFFIPIVNPDGYIYNETTNPFGGGLWRKNRKDNQNGSYGVDLNRNYSYVTPEGEEVWNTAGTSNNTSDNTYAGTMPFSEPESKAVRYFIELHEFKIALNNHSYSQLLLYPFGYDFNQPTEDNDTFVALSKTMVSQNGYANIIASDLYPAAGDSDDFMYGLLETENGGTREKIYAMTPEIGASFWPAASSIESICKEMVFHNLSAAKFVGNYAALTDLSSNYTNDIVTDAQFRLKRIGLSEPGVFTVNVTPVSDNILSVGSAATFNNLSYLETIDGSIAINLNPAILTGDTYTYDLIIDNGLFSEKQTLTKTYGEPSIFLNDPGDDTNTNWTTTSWSTTTEDYVSTFSSITDSPGSNYANGENSYLTLSNSIDLFGVTDANLTFQAKWDIESNYDYVQIEVSIDNGNSWIPQCGNFTNEGVTNQSNASGEPLYDGSQSTWVSEFIDLKDYIGESILLRFSLISDFGVTGDGFYFDDLKINLLQNTLSLDASLGTKFRLYPNPLKELLFIDSSVKDFDIDIYNLSGQLVLNSKGQSHNTAINCSTLASGVYLLKLKTDKEVQSFKIIKQ